MPYNIRKYQKTAGVSAAFSYFLYLVNKKFVFMLSSNFSARKQQHHSHSSTHLYLRLKFQYQIHPPQLE